MIQDRKFRFQMTKVFHDGLSGELPDDTFNVVDDDDDVLVVIDGLYVMANVEHMIVTDADGPETRSQGPLQRHLRTGTLRREVPLNYEKQKRVALFVRWYHEYDAQGRKLQGHGNSNVKYFCLPAEAEQPAEYVLLLNVLGHVRLDPIKKIGQNFVTRMYVEVRDKINGRLEREPRDRRDLIDMHEAQMAR